MRKLLISVLLLLFLFTASGCTENEKSNDELWEEIVNREYTGTSMQEAVYFFEENDIRYVRYMIRGSGVYCRSYYDLIINFNKAGHISFDIPEHAWNPSGPGATISLVYVEDGLFVWDDVEYYFEQGLSTLDYPDYYFEELFLESVLGTSEGNITRVGLYGYCE